jgi:hypothetical protein
MFKFFLADVPGCAPFSNQASPIRMAPKRRIRKQQEEHTHLALRVEGYEAEVSAAVNRHVYAPHLAYDFDDSDPLYKFTARLVITATSIDPEQRAGEAYELTIRGDDTRSHGIGLTLRDVQVRDEDGTPQYRKYRGRQVPVYTTRHGLGLLNKVAGEARWTAWLFVSVQCTNDMLTLLGHKRDLFVSLEEMRQGRDRWVRSISVQTTDPREE